MSAVESSPGPWKTRQSSPSCIFDQDGEVVAMVSTLQPGNRALVRAAPRMKEALEAVKALGVISVEVGRIVDKALADANKVLPE